MSDRISTNPHICHGKPVVAGTRVPVTIIVGSIAAGMSAADIEREYQVTPEDIRAALEHANSLVGRQGYHR